MSQLQIIIISSINFFAFLLFWYDKKQAIGNKNRISEFRLLFITFMGGTIGAILAMTLFRHKTSKMSFLIKFFAIVVFQLLLVYFLLSENL
jgi:uncharacterized membrane protein YsdA (DUF1294 family)